MNQEINNILLEEQVFEKEFLNLSIDEVNELYLHYCDVYESLKSESNIIVPEPISRNGCIIKYRLYELGESFADTLNEKKIFPLLNKSGEILRIIHDKKSLMHSDFVLHNLFTKNNMIFVIDPNPPALIGFRKDLLYGRQKYDVFSLLYSIIDSRGVKKTLVSPFNFVEMAGSFLSGYQYNFSGKDIFLLISYLRIVLAFRNKVKKNKFFSCLNLIFSFISILVVIIKK